MVSGGSVKATSIRSRTGVQRRRFAKLVRVRDAQNVDRRSWIVEKGRRTAFYLGLILAIAGCGDRSTMPYLGKWSGAFTVETVGKGAAVTDPRVTLSSTSVKIDDGGGEEVRNPNRAWIDPAALREAYSRPLALRLSKDGQHLTGLLVEVGPLTGTHSFVREGFGR